MLLDVVRGCKQKVLYSKDFFAVQVVILPEGMVLVENLSMAQSLRSVVIVTVLRIFALLCIIPRRQ